MGFSSVLDPRIKIIRKTADQTVNDSITLVNDTHLSFNIAANEKIWFQINLYADVKAASDFKAGLTVPAGAEGRWSTEGNASGDWTLANTISWSGTADRTAVYVYQGIIVNGATAGTVQLQWAQATAVAEDTTVKAGSNIIAIKV